VHRGARSHSENCVLHARIDWVVDVAPRDAYLPLTAPTVSNLSGLSDRLQRTSPAPFLCSLTNQTVPATPIRLPSGSVKWPTRRSVPGARSGPIWRLPPRLSAFWRAASTSGTPM
jgi:hypothetical protein